jgi:hypothetical protein
MPNHYHLLMQCKTDEVSEAMQRLSMAYTKAMNRRYNRVGSLFQGQFQAIAIQSNEYLYHLTRYIHLNPVKAGIVVHPKDWEFSSYLEYAGLRGGTLPKLSHLALVSTENIVHTNYRKRRQFLRKQAW